MNMLSSALANHTDHLRNNIVIRSIAANVPVVAYTIYTAFVDQCANYMKGDRGAEVANGNPVFDIFVTSSSINMCPDITDNVYQMLHHGGFINIEIEDVSTKSVIGINRIRIRARYDLRSTFSLENNSPIID